jgi:hypothetical protein
MPIRYRWHLVTFPNDGFDLGNVIAARPFSPNAAFGFYFIEGTTGSPSYRFLWRTKIMVTQFDDGAPSYQEVASVSFTDFAVICVEGSTFLRIENPGRNTRELLNALEALVGFGFTSKAVTFEKVKPSLVFENVGSIKLVGLKVVGAVIKEDLVARMEFASKEGMLIDELKFLEGLRYKVDFASYVLLYEGVRGQLAFSAGGTVKISGPLAPMLVHLIEKDLIRII